MLTLSKIRSRTRELQDAWKPTGLILSVLSGISSFREFRHRSGPYFFRGLAFSALAIAILFTVPVKSVRLFARRLVAFVIDLLLLGVGTIGCVSLLFEATIIRPSAVTSMAIVWSWVLLFVLLDWAFAGTPGKKIMGFRLKGKRTEGPSLLSCLARNLLSLVVPLTMAGSILSIVTLSKAGASAEWAIAVAILSFCPLSIIFSGGQSLPDLLVGITVLPKRSYEGQSPATLNRRNWLFLVLTSLLTGAAYGFTPSMESGFEGGEPHFPVRQVEVSGEAEAQMASALWPYLQARMVDPGDFLRDVRVYSAAGDFPGPAGQELDPQAAADCQQSFKARRTYKIVRMQIGPGVPSIVVSRLVANMVNTTNRFVGRPGFLVLEVSIRRSFGVFDLELPEDYILCLAGSDAAPENNFASASRTVSVQGSLNTLAWLFLGDLGRYSYVEKVPVYPW